MKYKRILLKLSGESLMGTRPYGIDPDRLLEYATAIRETSALGVEIAIVIGGGNIFRGMKGSGEGFERVTGDQMGMLATIINSMALESEFRKMGLPVLLLSGMKIDAICQLMSAKKAIDALSKNKIVILAGGTGNPYFTTDSAAALRALEIRADVILKGTRVDGVYNADPEKVKDAVKYDTLSFQQAYEQGLEIMDLTAFTLCRDNQMPIVVFDMNQKGNLLKVCRGEACGTLIHP